MRVVYLADNLFDAHLVKHALEEAEIPAFVFGVLRVCVPDTAFSDAEGVVQGLGLDSGGNGPLLEGDDEGLVILPA